MKKRQKKYFQSSTNSAIKSYLNWIRLILFKIRIAIDLMIPINECY